MGSDGLYSVDQWVTYVFGIVILCLAAETGLRLGRIRHNGRSARTSTLGAIESATLGLLALMIGFTFSMALSRFDGRKAVVLDEANAIGTAALRAQLLPPPLAKDAAGQLRDYAKARLALGEAGYDLARRNKIVAESIDLQNSLWREAVAAGTADPRSIPTGLFIDSVNHVIDMHEKRLTSLRDHVPDTAFVLLDIIAVIALGFTGYNAGAAGNTERGAKLIMALLIATVIMLITDLDRPYRGLVTISQQPLLDLIQGMQP